METQQLHDIVNLLLGPPLDEQSKATATRIKELCLYASKAESNILMFPDTLNSLGYLGCPFKQQG